MIIWGSGGNVKDLGQIELRHCETCEKERPMKLILQYRYAHLYYLRWVTEKRYDMACDVCRRGWQLENKVVDAKLETNPIPFMTRYGWAFLAGLVALAVIIAKSH